MKSPFKNITAVPGGSPVKGPSSPPGVPRGGVTPNATGTHYPVANQAGSSVNATGKDSKTLESKTRGKDHDPSVSKQKKQPNRADDDENQPSYQRNENFSPDINNNKKQPPSTSMEVTRDNSANDPPKSPTINRGGRGRGRFRGVNNRLLPHEQVKLVQKEIFQDLFTTRAFTRFYTVKNSDSDGNLSSLNVIKANKELLRTLKGVKPKKVDEMRNGSLLIEVINEEQGLQLQTLKTLDNTSVQVMKHGFLNQTRGTIYYRNRCNYSEADILDELKEQNVSNVYRTTRKVAGETIPNNIYILTFESCLLPDEITIGWNRCNVRKYIPRPRRCFKCQGFQHGSNSCRSQIAYCVNCGLEAHEQAPCTLPSKCKNCNEDHPASSTNCFYYKLAQEIINIQTYEKLNYRESRRRALEKLTNAERSYASVVATPSNNDRPLRRQEQAPKPNLQKTPNSDTNRPNSSEMRGRRRHPSDSPTTSPIDSKKQRQNERNDIFKLPVSDIQSQEMVQPSTSNKQPINQAPRKSMPSGTQPILSLAAGPVVTQVPGRDRNSTSRVQNPAPDSQRKRNKTRSRSRSRDRK